MERKKVIQEEKLPNLGPLNEQDNKTKRGPLTTAEKQAILQMLKNMQENGCKRSEAIKKTSKYCRRSIKMIRLVLKEKLILGDVMGGPYSRNRKSVYEKLTPEQRDTIRSVVHSEIRRVPNKEEGAQYPTLASLHAAIMEHPDIPKWSQTTSYRILKELGFV